MKTYRNPLQKEGSNPNKAKLLKKLLEFRATGEPIDLWLTFPQNLCCFAFGKHKGPVPIGALFLLWSAGWPYIQKCPDCKGNAYMVSFGGLLSYGGGHLICPTCRICWFQFLGGMVTVKKKYIDLSPLANTEYQYTGALFGGAYHSYGEELCKFLGVDEVPEMGSGVSVSITLPSND